jgi:RNA polymerase sigma-70 factor (ECF subfamily)
VSNGPALAEPALAEPALAEQARTRLDLRALYDEHGDRLRAAILRLGAPWADCEDLLHDVFIVALRKQREFEGRSAATTWLYGITIKIVAGARRRARLRRFLGLGEVTDAALATRGLFEQSEAHEVVYRVLDRMAHKKRTVFILFELEGLSGEEIAAALGCPLKTVWTRLHHARREFRAALADEHSGEDT